MKTWRVVLSVLAGVLLLNCHGEIDPKVYTFTYDGNGNTGGAAPVDINMEYGAGAPVTILGNTGSLVKTGYSFEGWNTTADGSGVDYATGATLVMPANAVILYARWKVAAGVTHTLTYDGNANTGGAVPIDANSPYAAGASVTVLGNTGNLVKAGFAFEGWNDAADGSGTSYAPAQMLTMPSNALILYAQWALTTYAVTYDGNGNTDGAAPVDSNSPYVPGVTVTVLGNTGSLVKAGYAFTGWNTAANGSGTAYAEAATLTMPASAVTLYAQWALVTYALTYDGNGNTSGTVPVDSSSPYAPAAIVTVLGNTGSLVKAGYVFVGWNTAADGTGTSYAPAAALTMPANAVILYAQWTLLTYGVTYVGNGNTSGAVPIDASSPYVPGATVTILGNTGSLVKAGSSFSGWNTAANGSGTSYAPADTLTMPSNAVTLFAQWTVITYAVTYDGNGNTAGAVPSDSNSPYAEGSTVTVLDNTGALVKGSDPFSGWNTAADGSGTSYLPASTFVMSSAAVTLYAQYLTNQTVSFDANGGIGVMTPQGVANGMSINLPFNVFTKASYVFAGWATSPTGAIAYNDGQPLVMGSASITLYAVWALSSSLVLNYNFDGQNANDSSAAGNNGDAIDVAYVADGAGGYSASLNGSSSFIDLPSNIIRSTPSFTVMLRFKATASQNGILFGYQNGAVGSTPSQYLPVISVRADGKLRGELWVGSELEVISVGAVNDEQWHTVYLSVATGAITFYLDGVNIVSSPSTIQHLGMTVNQVGTGRATGRTLMPNVDGALNNWFFFNGLIDDVYVYSPSL